MKQLSIFLFCTIYVLTYAEFEPFNIEANVNNTTLNHISDLENIELINFELFLQTVVGSIRAKDITIIKDLETYILFLLANTPVQDQATMLNQIDQLLFKYGVAEFIKIPFSYLKRTLYHTKKTKKNPKPIKINNQYKPLPNPERIHGGRRTMNRLKRKYEEERLKKIKAQQDKENARQKIREEQEIKAMQEKQHATEPIDDVPNF